MIGAAWKCVSDTDVNLMKVSDTDFNVRARSWMDLSDTDINGAC